VDFSIQFKVTYETEVSVNSQPNFLLYVYSISSTHAELYEHGALCIALIFFLKQALIFTIWIRIFLKRI
jgi:hypothetical protein